MRPPPPIEIVSATFKSIRSKMLQGLTKAQACKATRTPRSWIYKHFSKEQMAELDQIYFSFSKGSTKTKWKMERNIEGSAQ